MTKVVYHPAARQVATRYLTCAETARLVRKALSEAFPGVRFSVRSHTYAGGARIEVRYTDGPAAADVKRVTKVFEGATFDSMADYKGGRVHALAQEPNQPVHFGADFIFVKQEISPAHLEATRAAIAALTEDQRSALEARLRIGAFAAPYRIERGDRAYVDAVALATLPKVEPQPSPTAQSVRTVREY